MTMPKQLQSNGFQPKERAAAKAVGQTTYFTGRPCKHGHVDFRCTASGVCLECSKLIQKRTITKRLKNNPNHYKEKYALNPEKYRLQAEKYRNKFPERVKESNQKMNVKRKPQKAAAEMKRIATKLNATPKWLSKDDFDWIDAYYVEAQKHKEMFGMVLAVDHIVPLKGKQVCGLHVPWNMCLRTKSDNSKKHNKLTDEAYLPKQSGILIATSALPWNLRKENYVNLV
jgi:hypothetical protein